MDYAYSWQLINIWRRSIEYQIPEEHNNDDKSHSSGINSAVKEQILPATIV